MSSLVLAEELMLLCLDESSGAFLVSEKQLEKALARALVLDAMLQGNLELRDNRIVRVTDTPLTDPLLTRAVTQVQGSHTKDVDRVLATGDLVPAVVDQLMTKEALPEPSPDVPHGLHSRARLRRSVVQKRIRAALVEHAEASRADAALIHLLQRLKATALVVPEVNRRRLRVRAARIAARGNLLSGDAGQPDHGDVLALIQSVSRLFH